MTTERATKIVDRLEAIGLKKHLGEYYSRNTMIRQFEQKDESELDPNYIKFMDMSDSKFKLLAPMLKGIVNVSLKQQERIIKKNLQKMTTK